MKSLDNYIISNNNLVSKRILTTWTWLTENKTLIALTKMGDALLKDDQNKLYHLDTGNASLKLISEKFIDFLEGKLDNEVYEEILLPDLVDKLNSIGKNLKTNQVYAFYKIPLIGGEYSVDNIYQLDLYEHYGLSGEIHFKFKNLPDGTRVDINLK